MKQNEKTPLVYDEVFENCDGTDLRWRVPLDLNWEFIEKDLPDGAQAAFDDASRRLVNLPHDWSIEGEYDQANPSGGSGGFLPTGIGWYRKTLQIPEAWRKGRKVSLVFDGVFCNSTVYANGVLVGGRRYGWLSFSCDITEQVKENDRVVIAVKVDNSVQPSARWYAGSGIYSHVWLVSTRRIHVAENGVYITTPAEDTKAPSGEVKVETTVQNGSDAQVDVTVRATVYRKVDGVRVVQSERDGISVGAGKTAVVTQSAFVSQPLLWSVDDPHLYRMKTEILVDGAVTDDVFTEFGFRSVAYDVKGLYLNGVKTKLRGVANHWALGALGAAQSKNIIRYKIQLMKDMGVNCIRTAHNACPPEFYGLCNEMGMMVLDELFEGERGKTAGDYGTRWFADHWKTDVEYWIKRDRSHPCVVVWSIGNEIGSQNDNTGISAHIKNFDTSRPTTGSLIYTGVDIPGANGISERKDYTQPISDLPLIATEAPHTHAVRGVYRTRTWFRGTCSDGSDVGKFLIPHLADSEVFRYDWDASAVGPRILPSDYDNAVSQISVRKHWSLTRDHDWRLGEFRWTGFDYLGEANYVLGGWPYRMFHSGAVDSALFAKSMYYLYQSMWSETPMLHILPSWTHPTVEAGAEIPVWVYSNCERVELFLNGNSMGMVDRGPVGTRDEQSIQFDWLVPYEEGTLTAVGYDGQGKELLRDTYTTASAPAALMLNNTTGEELPADPFWVGQVTVSTVDKDGIFYPYGENRSYYHISGPAYVKAVDNGSPTDIEGHKRNNRRAFMGLSKVYVVPTGEEGDVLFTAASILGERRQLTSDKVHIDVRQMALRGNPQEDSFEIYYTTDGSMPTKASAQYTGPFSVALNTTVKAAVYCSCSEAPLFVMEEFFGENEGMYWPNTGARATEDVCSAADARVEGEGVTKVSYGYEDKYINFRNKPGAAEYTYTAERAGDYYVAVCYNNGSGAAGEFKALDVFVNDSFVCTRNFMYNGPWDTFWSYHLLKVSLTEGENRIRFQSPFVAGPNLKELIFYPAEHVLSADKAILTQNETVVAAESAVEGKTVDVGQGGVIPWHVSDRKAGTYRMRVCYSSPRASLREVSGAVNGTRVAIWSGTKVSPDYGSAWGFCEKEISLAPGKNVLAVSVPSGGTYVSALVLSPLAEFGSLPSVIEAACTEGLRLSVVDSEVVALPCKVGEGGAMWNTVINGKGFCYFVHRDSGRLLVSDGHTVSLAEGETDGNAQWMRTGEMEHFDYLVHVKTGKVLALDGNGKIFVDDPNCYNDADRTGNRAYWKIF